MSIINNNNILLTLVNKSGTHYRIFSWKQTINIRYTNFTTLFCRASSQHTVHFEHLLKNRTNVGKFPHSYFSQGCVYHEVCEKNDLEERVK